MAEPVAWDAPPMPAHPLVGVTAFTMERRVTRREQYCEFRPLGLDGVEGDVALYATQRQFRLREEYLFSTDREHTRPFMIVRARAGLNLVNAGFDAYDERGAPIGWSLCVVGSTSGSATRRAPCVCRSRAGRSRVTATRRRCSGGRWTPGSLPGWRSCSTGAA